MTAKRTRRFPGTLRGIGWVARAASGLLALTLAFVLPLAGAAEGADVPTGSTVRVANTDGAGLNLREAPGLGAAVVVLVAEGTVLEVIGRERQADGLRWLNVRAPGGQSGWAAADFLSVVSTPTPTATPRAASGSSANAGTPTPTPSRSGGRLEVDARIKLPETDARDQEITVTVLRRGQPVPGAQVQVTTRDADPPLVRELDPTDAEGRTVREFDIRREKGTVVLLVTAVAPDGGEGEDTVSYFRR